MCLLMGMNELEGNWNELEGGVNPWMWLVGLEPRQEGRSDPGPVGSSMVYPKC